MFCNLFYVITDHYACDAGYALKRICAHDGDGFVLISIGYYDLAFGFSRLGKFVLGTVIDRGISKTTCVFLGIPDLF